MGAPRHLRFSCTDDHSDITQLVSSPSCPGTPTPVPTPPFPTPLSSCRLWSRSPQPPPAEVRGAWAECFLPLLVRSCPWSHRSRGGGEGSSFWRPRGIREGANGPWRGEGGREEASTGGFSSFLDPSFPCL